MRLVEVVQCKHTSVKASQAALGVAKRLGKVGVLVRTLSSCTFLCNIFSIIGLITSITAAVYLYVWRI